LLPVTPGQYTGGLPLSGEKSLRLRLIAAEDPEKIAEVVIPGSRKQERQVSVISELGPEFLFAMMPEAQAIPLRGGYLSKGEEGLVSPLLVEEIVTDHRLIQVRNDVEALALVNLDLMTGDYSTQLLGNVSVGTTINVASTGTMSMTFAGGFVDGEPFEAYTTFIQPTHFNLSVDTPSTLKPRDNLVIRLGCEGVSETVPVLVCVRDARLTATEMPAVSLGASAKRNIDAALVDMNEWSFVGWQELPPPYDEFTAIFLDEAEEILENTQSLLERWQATPDNLPLMRELQRELHTLKGSARIVGISAMADLSHSLESVLNRIVEGGVQSNSKLQEIVQNSVDELAALLEAVRAGVPLDMPTDLIALINTSLTVGGEGRRELEAERAYYYRQEMEETTAMPPESYAMPPPAVTSAPPAAVTSKPAPPQTRTEFPEMLFYGLVPVTGTTHDLVLPVGEALTTWVVETFALRHGDWAQARTTVVVDQPVRLDLEVPPAVYPQDNVVGRIHVVTASGLARLRLHCDGQPVELRSGQLTWCNPDSIVTPAELEFPVTPGHYQATVEDLHTHDTDSIETTVQEPTKVKSYRKALHLLQSGETVTLDSANAVTLRLLPTLDTPFNALISATADYGHLCCEQTAAKIMAATLMYLTASDDPTRHRAEQIIMAGIAREQKMFRPGRGFAAYPESDYINVYYSQCAVFRLWHLQPLEALSDLSSNLRHAIQEGLDMANQAAVVHQLQRIPDRITQMEDAYTLATLQKMPEAIHQFIDSLLDFTGTEVRLRKPNHQVADRTLLAYAAASLIALKDWQRGLRLANQVTQQFNAQGALYSTVDSVAAIALLQQLKLANIGMGKGQLRVNSKAMTLEEALTLAEPVTSVEVIEGVAAVEVTYLHTEDWDSFGQPFPITVEFRETDSASKKKKRFALGNRLTLHITLPQGYRLGDLAHVVLPPCLSAIEGGAKVKRFTLDFAGHNQLRIPLLVTSKLQGVQHFAVCVRNMFEEERASSTGLLTVTSEPRDSESR
jgi:HPt (histidine-containing phosphotransfer) domain-containing protein